MTGAPLHAWSDTQQLGVSFYVTSDGHLRLKHQGLRPADLAYLRVHRARIVAEWLWMLRELPSQLEWEAAIAEQVLAVGVELMAGPAFLPSADWTPVVAAQAAVDGAWTAEDLLGLVRATQAWVLAVYSLRRPAESLSASAAAL